MNSFDAFVFLFSMRDQSLVVFGHKGTLLDLTVENFFASFSVLLVNVNIEQALIRIAFTAIGTAKLL